MKNTILVTALSTVLGLTALEPASAAGLADGYYDMVINNTPYTGGSGYDVGTDGAWNSSFTFGALPGISSQGLYDDTIAQPVNGKYSGTPNDGAAATIGIQVSGGVISGTGKFEFDTIAGTAFGSFAEYGGSGGFTGTIDGSGNISLTPSGVLGTASDFPFLVDRRWNVDDFTSNGNTVWDSFSTGSASNAYGTISGAAYDGTTAVLVKGGHVGSDWGCCFGAGYFEVWNVSFVSVTTPVPVPAAIWLFGSGLIGLTGIARSRKR